MIWRLKISGVAVICLLALAGGYTATESDDEVAYDYPSKAEPISPVNVDGVWVFEHTPSLILEALMSGEADVVNGCLVVGDTVVVWHSEKMDTVRDLVDRVEQDEQLTVELGGGGFSQEEGGDDFSVPPVIDERCSPVTSVWYGSTHPITVTPHSDDSGCTFAPAPLSRPLGFLIALL